MSQTSPLIQLKSYTHSDTSSVWHFCNYIYNNIPQHVSIGKKTMDTFVKVNKTTAVKVQGLDSAAEIQRHSWTQSIPTSAKCPECNIPSHYNISFNLRLNLLPIILPIHSDV